MKKARLFLALFALLLPLLANGDDNSIAEEVLRQVRQNAGNWQDIINLSSRQLSATVRQQAIQTLRNDFEHSALSNSWELDRAVADAVVLLDFKSTEPKDIRRLAQILAIKRGRHDRLRKHSREKGIVVIAAVEPYNDAELETLKIDTLVAEVVEASYDETLVVASEKLIALLETDAAKFVQIMTTNQLTDRFTAAVQVGEGSIKQKLIRNEGTESRGKLARKIALQGLLDRIQALFPAISARLGTNMIISREIQSAATSLPGTEDFAASHIESTNPAHSLQALQLLAKAPRPWKLSTLEALGRVALRNAEEFSAGRILAISLVESYFHERIGRVFSNLRAGQGGVEIILSCFGIIEAESQAENATSSD